MTCNKNPRIKNGFKQGKFKLNSKARRIKTRPLGLKYKVNKNYKRKVNRVVNKFLGVKR
jgi:hypothetical protein